MTLILAQPIALGLVVAIFKGLELAEVVQDVR